MTNNKGLMIQAGYMAKHISARPEWLKAEQVIDICSVSNCVSDDFADFIDFWKHNGFWLFDSPEVIRQAAIKHDIDLSGTTLFFYEVYGLEFDENDGIWKQFEPDSSLPTYVVTPKLKQFEGYDVVTFYAGTSPECSPLSCNGLAAEVRTTPHCLLDSFEYARQLLEQGMFNDSEPGPYRIFAVYSVDWVPISVR